MRTTLSALVATPLLLAGGCAGTDDVRGALVARPSRVGVPPRTCAELTRCSDAAMKHCTYLAGSSAQG
jgi:hypothetical protein